jgi:hypothetical protein
MTDVAIRVENLSKRSRRKCSRTCGRISSAQQVHYKTLRDALTDMLTTSLTQAAVGRDNAR